jgi:hypothetical protein
MSFVNIPPFVAFKIELPEELSNCSPPTDTSASGMLDTLDTNMKLPIGSWFLHPYKAAFLSHAKHSSCAPDVEGAVV